jgi:hypothetical protein
MLDIHQSFKHELLLPLRVELGDKELLALDAAVTLLIVVGGEVSNKGVVDGRRLDAGELLREGKVRRKGGGLVLVAELESDLLLASMSAPTHEEDRQPGVQTR